jgi:hypothetical protein
MPYVHSFDIWRSDANIPLSSQDPSMNTTPSIMSSWSEMFGSQDTTLTTNDQLSALDTTLSQYIASLFPTHEGSSFTSTPSPMPDHGLQNGFLAVALAFTPDRPQFATPLLISCTVPDHVTIEPIRPKEAAVMTGISTAVSPSYSNVDCDMSEVSSTPEGRLVTSTTSQEEDLPNEPGTLEDETQPAVGITTMFPQSSPSLSASSFASSSSPSSAEPASPPSTQTHHTFTCRIDNCATDLHVNFPTLEAHLGAVHHYPPVRRGHALECRWIGVGCAARKEDIAKHIWEAHLDFQTPCPKCGEVGWAPGFSMNRHKKTCAGRKPARCQMCYELFPSELMLGAHYESQMCPRRILERGVGLTL